MKKFNCLLISPASIFDPKDAFTTGVVYMPIGLAYGAAALQENGIEVAVIDLFGNEPKRSEFIGDYVRLGASDDCITMKIASENPDLIVFYANQVLNHTSLLRSIKKVRESNFNGVIGVAENTQAVTSYLLTVVADEIFDAGADFIISGEMEDVLIEVTRKMIDKESFTEWNIDGVSTRGRVRPRVSRIANLDELARPAWSQFPIRNYWKLGYAHGPFETESYFPLLTSRGCPFPCKFCVVPSTNSRKWRFRSAANVVDEIEYLLTEFGVTEFHLEDLNPTIQDSRMQQIALEIISRDLEIKWKIVAGTKIESIKSLETLRLMKKSGLNYLSMSPESGSEKVLKEIGKPFDVNHAVRMIKESYRLGIKTQTCFVLGYPTEKSIDRLKSLILVMKLTIVGVDEIVVFIMTPVPGSAVYESFKGQFNSLSSLSFSPRWRLDFSSLLAWRMVMYFTFLTIKFFRNPIRMLRQIKNLITGSFQTKMEMTPIRGLKYLMIARKLQRGKL